MHSGTWRPVLSLDRMADRDKEKSEALRRLHAVLIRKLSAQDIKHDLYGKGQLTSAEMDRIGTGMMCSARAGRWREKNYMRSTYTTASPLPTAEAEQTRQRANEQLLIALERRGPNVLDVLVECLMEEKEANKDLIEAIRKGVV